MMNIELVIINNIIELQTTGLPYTPPHGGGAVDSVNGKTGDVTLVANDVGAYSKSESDNLLSGKVDKEAGKGLSTNDYTNADKTKVSKIVTDGLGDKYLSDDGNYKTVSGGGGGVSEVDVKGWIAKNIAVKDAYGGGIVPPTASQSGSLALGSSAIANSSHAIAIGTSSNGLGSQVIAIGKNARASGGDNVAIGSTANASAYYAVAIGKDAVSAHSTISIGYRAGANSTTYTNCSHIGSSSDTTSSNQVQLGGSTTTTYAYGAVQDRSDARDKTDIQDCTLGLDFINALRPVKYKWDYREDYFRDIAPQREDFEDEESYIQALEQARVDFFENPVKDGSKTRNREHHGLIAQEFKQVLDNLGIDHAAYQDHSVNDGMDVKSIGYAELIPNLIKAIQDISAKVESLENGILIRQ